MKRFRFLSILLALVLCLALVACGFEQTGGTESGAGSGSGSTEPGSGSASNEPSTGETSGEPGGIPATPTGHVLVVYFSASGNTEIMAQYIVAATGADTFEITPKEPYTSADLNWTDTSSRVVNEHNAYLEENLTDVALESTVVPNWESYDIVFIGYPIWWGIAAWPVNTFVKANDFSGKTVIPFCTSLSSGLGDSAKNLKEMANGGEWLEGERFQSSAPQSAVEAWIESLGLHFDSDEPSSAGFPITQEAPGKNAVDGGPQSASNITSVNGVPLITLNNGVQMPRFGLGTQIQSMENGDLTLLNTTSRSAVAAALQAGYRHLDDAHGYLNEKGVAQGIRDSGVPREQIWITDKLWPSEYANAADAIDQMLSRLGVDYIDLLYLHHPAGDIETIQSAWRAMEDAYRAGKIRALGISNFDNRMEAFNAIMNEEIKPQVMQIECHPFAQRTAARALAEQYAIQVECWYPLGHADQRLLHTDTLEAIAAAHEKSVVQIIIRWHIQEGFSVIPGSTNPDHIEENISIFDFELTDEEMEQIRAMDEDEGGRYFNIDYERMGGMFLNPPREWTGNFN